MMESRVKARRITHPRGALASSPPAFPERPFAGLQVVQVLKTKRELLNARVGGLQFTVGGIAVYRRIAFGYRKIKATVSPQLTSLSSIEPVIKV